MLTITVVFVVYADGSICLDILQNRWSPTYDVSAILTSIQVSDINSQYYVYWQYLYLSSGNWYHWQLIPLTTDTSDSWYQWQLISVTVDTSDSWHQWQLTPVTVDTSDSWHQWQLTPVTIDTSDSWYQWQLMPVTADISDSSHYWQFIPVTPTIRISLYQWQTNISGKQSEYDKCLLKSTKMWHI